MTERTDEQIGRASLETKTPAWHGDGTDGGVYLDSGSAGIEPWQVNAPIWHGDAQKAEAASDTSWLQAALDRCEAATEGPWYVAITYDGLGPILTACGKKFVAEVINNTPGGEADAKFIAHARRDLPRALELLRQAAEALEAAIAGIKFACEYYAPSASAEAQIMAHINGYDGNPDGVAILDRIRKGDSE